jgi:hypothetical protein
MHDLLKSVTTNLYLILVIRTGTKSDIS